MEETAPAEKSMHLPGPPLYIQELLEMPSTEAGRRYTAWLFAVLLICETGTVTAPATQDCWRHLEARAPEGALGIRSGRVPKDG